MEYKDLEHALDDEKNFNNYFVEDNKELIKKKLEIIHQDIDKKLLFKTNIKEVEKLYLQQVEEILNYYERILYNVLEKSQISIKYTNTIYNDLYDIIKTYENLDKLFNS